MSPATPYFEVVILTSRDRRAIHAEALRKANPLTVFHVYESIMESGAEAWRNCDRNIIDAWRDLRARIKATHVLFLEWDVFANVDLARRFGKPSESVIGSALKSPVTDRRTFLPFRELERLPDWIRQHAIGLVPSAVLMVPAAVLNLMAYLPMCADAFALDIISEIRFGSMAKALGYQVATLPGMAASVHTRPFQPAAFEEGIFHPVKEEVAP